MIINLIRTESGLEGTFGIMLVYGKRFYTAELPWKDNQKGKSCIPYGEYECEIVDSPKFGLSYQVKDVVGRTHILFHAGNWAGDEEAGYASDSDGCILIGEALGRINEQACVTSSRKALAYFKHITDGRPFQLIISGFDVW